MKNRYRIVEDTFLGYEAQVKFWWFPLMWFQMGSPVNTHRTVEAAEAYIRRRAQKPVKDVRL